MNKAFDLYRNYGNNGYIGEDVSQLEHATQTALLAEKENPYSLPYRRELILASFLHDVGHLLCFEDKTIEKMGELGVKKHEDLGADYLFSLGFSSVVCDLVRNHIKAKRYLITMDEDYYNNLSEASKQTYLYQGGKLNNQELEEFEKNPYFDYHLKLRSYDDRAKSIDPVLLYKIKTMNPTYYFASYI